MFQEIYDKDYLDFYDSVKCIGDLGEKWCNFKWRIYNIQLNPRETFQSPAFTTRLLPKIYWYLEIKLSSPGNLRTLKIALRRFQSDEEVPSVVDVIYKVDFGDETKISDKSKVIFTNEKPLNEGSDYSVSFCKSKADYVTVGCKLRPNKEMIKDVLHRNMDPALPVHLRKLLKSGELYDTVIQVRNQQLMAHYIILRERLPNLLPLTVPVEVGKRIIKIDDLPISVVKEMLKYAYTGQACVDLEAVSVNKDVLVKYNEIFYHRCCWEDNPFATTFFNYETDSILWNLERLGEAKNIGYQEIDLLRLYPSKIKFWLDVLESEDEKCLWLSFRFCSDEMPKSTIVSCNYFLQNGETNETHELGVAETLLSSNITQGEVKLCTLLEVDRAKSTLCASDVGLNLKVDLKFCYGSNKSSLENVYEGQFDISQCTSCAMLSSDMNSLYRFRSRTDITVMSGNQHKVQAHKAILIARWEEAERLNVKENDCISIEGYTEKDLLRFIRYLYTGNAAL